MGKIKFVKPKAKPEAKGVRLKPVLIKVADLRSADWNYKLDDDSQTEKLKASIVRDGTPGVLAVREVKDGYEVIDGNHRFRAVRELGFTEVWCENFGPISQAEAVLIAHRRNTQWFSDDAERLAMLYKNVVIPTVSLDDLKAILPGTMTEVERFLSLTEFDWNSVVPTSGDGNGTTVGDSTSLAIKLTREQYAQWKRWLKVAYAEWNVKESGDALAKLIEVGLKVLAEMKRHPRKK